MSKTHDLPVAGRLEARDLRLVLAVGSEQSVTRAAGRLHLSQSAVSHQLRDLERDLETRLFDRVGKRMVPTAAGTRMMAAAQRLLEELGALEVAVRDECGTARVPLRVTASCFTSYHWLPAALAHFGDTHPNIDLEIVLEATKRTMEALIADEVDVAIVTQLPREDTWQHTELITSELVALTSPRHPVVERARRGVLGWSALRDCQILVYDISEHDLGRLDGAVRDTWRAETGQRLTTPITVRKVPLSQALVELARSGRGVGIVDRWTIAEQLGRDLIALSMAPRAPRTFHGVWRRANPRELPISELVGLIRKAGQRATRIT